MANVIRFAGSILAILVLTGTTLGGSNLVKSPGFEGNEAQAWPVAGRDTSVKLVTTQPHSGKVCLYVFDNGEQGGQANAPYFTTPPGIYYVEGWLRVDPEHASLALLDVQFFDTERRYLGAAKVGETTSAEWTLLAAVVMVPEEAAWVRLRVQPAYGENKFRGACFVDDLYMAPYEQAKQERPLSAKHEVIPCANTDPSGQEGEPPPDIADRPLAHKSQMDFEDLSGWQLETLGRLKASFCRSRDQRLGGEYVGKLTFATEGEVGWAVLRPPKPMPIGKRSEAVQVWIHSDRRPASWAETPPWLTIVLRQRGKQALIPMPKINWSFWTIAHWRLAEPVDPEAEIVELRLEGLQTKKGETRQLYLDELAFHNEPTKSLDLKIPSLPCPTRPETILPTFGGRFENQVTGNGGAFRLAYRDEDEAMEYVYQPCTGALDDLTVRMGEGASFRPTARGGPVLSLSGRELPPTDKDLKPELVRAGIEKDAVTALWRYRVGQDVAEVKWELRIRGKSLVLTLDESKGKVSKWLFGKPEGQTVQELAVPYLTYHCDAGPVYLVGRQVFVFCQPDWYVSHASAFTSDGCEYVPLLNGRRNALRERIFLTVSADFHEVLPNIPNPPSPTARVLGENVYVNMSGSLEGDGLERCLTLWREMNRMGLEKLIVKHHAHTFSSHSGQGNEPFVQRVKASVNIPGGDEALAHYIRQVKALGMEYFLYTDYCIFAPVNSHFDEGLVTLDPKGQWTPGWYQYYALTPLMSPVLAAEFAPKLREKYGLTGSYCDQHTARPPSGWVDYDPRKPGAGMLQTVFRAYCRVFEIEKKAYEGPVVSEGGNYWFYAGMADGNYAQLRPPKGVERSRMPFLVDFDLLKIHPLQVDLGMGWRGSYGYDRHAKNWDDALDRFLCATIAFGHSGILYGPNFPSVSEIDRNDPLGKWKRSAARTYFMIQGLASRYALVPVQRIAYWDGSRLVTPSEALRSSACDRSQIAVEYANGLRVFANGSFEYPWRVELNRGAYDLPPNGWLAAQGDEFLEYSALRDGHRVDFVRSPIYTFADGRGQLTDFGGGVQAKDALIILHQRNGERHEIGAPMGP